MKSTGPEDANPAAAAHAADDAQALPPDVPSIHAAEEALAAALVEVERTEKELRAAEEVLERLQNELAGRLADAERLMTMVAEAYERERERLERELQSIQARAWDLEHARDGRPEPGRGDVDLPPELAEVFQEPATATAPPAPEASRTIDEVFAPAQPDAAPASAEAPRSHDVFATQATDAAAPAPAPRRKGKGADKGGEDPNAEGYEDHWYQVLRQGEQLGGGADRDPSDAPAGR